MLSERFFVMLLGGMMGLQPISTDVYLAALPALTQHFNGTMSQAQLTMSAMLMAFGVAQLVWGTLSDRVGRRPVLLWGFALYALAALAAIFVRSMEMLIACRVAQGIALGAVVVCARATVRDLYSPQHGPAVMSKGFSALGVIACLGFPLGALVSLWFSAHAVFVVLAAYAFVLLGLIWHGLPETRPQPALEAENTFSLLQTLVQWLDILKNPIFQTYCLVTTSTFCATMVFITCSSFVFMGQLAFSPLQYAAVMSTMSATYIGSTFLCRWFLVRYGLQRTMKLGGWMSLLGASGLVFAACLFNAAGEVHRAWAFAPHFLVVLGHGTHQSCGQSLCVAPFAHSAGTASALNGFLMTLGVFLTGLWLGPAMSQDVSQAMVQGIVFWVLVLAFAALVLVPRNSVSQA